MYTAPYLSAMNGSGFLFFFGYLGKMFAFSLAEFPLARTENILT